METFLRSHLGSNLMLPQSGFALINSIMSLFDVELSKTQREHTTTSFGLHRVTLKERPYESDVGSSLLRDTWLANQVLALISFLRSPRSVSDLHLDRVFFVSCSLP